jgi:hypothetical protein
MWQTTGGEIAAFFLARAMSLAVYYAANAMFLGPLYLQVYKVGGRAAMMAFGIAIGLVGWLITLLLLVVVRGGLGGVPPAVAVDRNAIMTSGAEIGAFLLAFVANTMLLTMLNTLVIAGIYQWLRVSGHTGFTALVALGVSAVSAVVFFVIFVALRGAMVRPAPAGGAGVRS